METTKTAETGRGFITVRSVSARDALPVAGARIRILNENETQTIYSGVTDADGVSETIEAPCPPRELSLQEANAERPYGVYTLYIEHDGYEVQCMRGLQVFDGQTSLCDTQLLPRSEMENAARLGDAVDVSVIPPHALYAGGGGSAEAPISTCAAPRVLAQPVVPTTITVHLGKPSADAQNVTVSFRDYIKNVASSEVYPTWEDATKPTRQCKTAPRAESRGAVVSLSAGGQASLERRAHTIRPAPAAHAAIRAAHGQRRKSSPVCTALPEEAAL